MKSGDQDAQGTPYEHKVNTRLTYPIRRREEPVEKVAGQHIRVYVFLNKCLYIVTALQPLELMHNPRIPQPAACRDASRIAGGSKWRA